ncbi:hypothetical protein ACH4GK_36800 [Streptomyces rimosus]|uniref:hypothetical protein n=1 Tax=Streptomyces TaxID=1883 RepID=UPI0004C8C4CC|nr:MULTISPECIES: hypothetical protein [Streptomyces]RSO11312.1 hypothetical protein DMH18_10880 [Streptomyces sp. WAC 06783]RSO40800.1 hypothetical protein DMH15_14430 [Streptomyces sp. WAC 06725]
MKTTMMFRNIANPRRTTLAHLKDADELQSATAEAPEHAVELPTQTANPRRTVLKVAPAPHTVPAQATAPETAVDAAV